MGGGSNTGMEGILHFIRNDEGDIERHWMSFLSNDAKRQDAKTSYLNSCKLIDTLREKHGLLRGGRKDVLSMRSDGCAKQWLQRR